jgi:hypothetical protein
MNLAHSLNEHERELGRSAGPRRAAALRLLRKYFVEYADLSETEALSTADLEDLFVRWYLEHESADPEGALDLLEAAEAWLRWLDGRDEGRRALAFLALAERLREDLPRAIAAHQILRTYVHRHDWQGVAAEDEVGETLFHVSGGLTHVVRPEEVDYARAEEDHFRVEEIEGDRARIQSPAGEQLGSLGLSPLLLPPGVAPLLRVGDTLRLEVAPTVEGWEVLEVSGVFPGGYHAAAL